MNTNQDEILEITAESDKEAQGLQVSEGKMMKEIYDFVKDLAFIIVLVVLIRTFLILPFQINGQSMYDSYYDRGFIIVDRFSYLDIPYIKDGHSDRGDVVVFKPHINKEREYYIKRIIGLPNEQVKIAEGKVYLKTIGAPEFVELDEPYLSEENNGSTFVKGEPHAYIFEVPEGHYFVMGDNRIASTDSRSCFSSCSVEGRTNYISDDDLMGKVLVDLGYFSIKKLDFIHPVLGIPTTPRWFSSPSHFEYSLK